MKHMTYRRGWCRVNSIVKTFLACALACAPVIGAQAQPATAGSHALILHGQPKYGADFSHFEYTNPDAPKGGTVRLHSVGTYDSLNPYILKGVAAAGAGFLVDTLTESSSDEAFTEYGLIAERVAIAADNASVEFFLRASARFNDGSPITADDVAFSLDTLKRKGHPFYRAYYKEVERAEVLGPRRVKFYFKSADNRELPLIIGQMPVFSKAYWSEHSFEKTTLNPFVSSGPYRVKALDPGRSITYERDPEYWGRDLPVNKGRYNFDTIRYDYYRDQTVALEAFKAGEYDFRSENTAKVWATGYDGPALRAGLIKKESIKHQNPTGMQGFWFNTRKELFKDPKVRAALAYAFDFEWANKNLFYNAYTRTASFFSNSELASSGLPDARELKILEPFRGRIPDEVFTKTYTPPVTEGSKGLRRNLRKALKLLKLAGWRVDKASKRLVNKRTGKRFEFEMLLVQPAFERVVLPFKKNLERLGIVMKVRTVDTSQYQKRVDDFDFDMLVFSQGQSLSPGNEQRSQWGSAAADQPGSRNLAGIKDPVVDKLIDLIVNAPDRESLIVRTRALDRVLLWGHYVIPHWHVQSFRVAYWDKFARPKISPKYGLGFDTWWVNAAKAAKLAEHKRGLKAN